MRKSWPMMGMSNKITECELGRDNMLCSSSQMNTTFKCSCMVIPLPGRLGQSNTAQFIHVNIDTGNRKT
jgi:hypothetical protein